MKSFTTGEVAKICGFKNSRFVANLIDKEELKGFLKPITWQRRTWRLVNTKDLIDYMKKNNISFDNFPVEEIEDEATKFAVALLQARTDVLLKVG